LGNIVYEREHNRTYEYWHNSLNQQVRGLEDGRDNHTFSFDNRGNLIQGIHHCNQNHSNVIESYEYDATNRMVRGTNGAGETSRYTD